MQAGNTGRRVRLATGLGLAVVLLVVARSLSILPSPGEMRLRRLDALRIQHLEAIDSAIGEYWREYKHLPASLEELPAPDRELVLQDPRSGEPYGYEVLSEREYRLCARFDAASPGQGAPPGRKGGWRHPAGEHCWTLGAGSHESRRYL
jgi:hypothetical protein